MQLRARPPRGLQLVVVIPCRDEPEILTTLTDLSRCDNPGVPVEVLVVVNASEADGEALKNRNATSCRAIRAWAAQFPCDRWINFHAMDFPSLPPRHAGVGLARKIGMDEAVSRLSEAGSEDGIIVGLDADCRCEPNYLVSLVRHFARFPDSPACSLYFEHPLEASGSNERNLAIAEYELYLRYYRHGLKYAGHPCAHYTVGSCMAVRASAYTRQGGMNRRQAAEDFYFLNKLMLLGNFTELRETTVRPSPRVSDRVPFGTGRAMREALEKPAQTLEVYSPIVFDDMAALLSRIDGLRDSPGRTMAALPGTAREFLMVNGIDEKLAEIRAHTATMETFRRRFLRWFDGFRALKFVRYASEATHGREPVDMAAKGLLARRGLPGEVTGPSPGTLALLMRFRRIDQQGARSATKW